MLMALQTPVIVRNEFRHPWSLSQNLAVGELNGRASVESIIRSCSVNRPLRWHERLLIRLLLRSPRVDKVLIVQYGTSHPLACSQSAARMQQDYCRQQLEKLYQSS